MIAEDDDNVTARSRRLLLQLLEAAHDLQRVRLTVENVAELDERRFSRRPMTGLVSQARGAGYLNPSVIIAMEIADSNDSARQRRWTSGWHEEEQGRKR
jgi:hypothetical protein